MAEKISTLILKVDLSCHLCYKKIRKVLCKLQDKEHIQSITYDEKGNAVIISGPFDPQKLSKKLKCKACKVIKEIQIKEEKEKPKEKPKSDPPPKPKEDPPKPKEVVPPKPKEDPPKPKEVVPPKPKEDPPKPKEDPPKPKATPIQPEPEPIQTVPVNVVQEPELYPPPPMWAPGPVCCGRPCFDGGYQVGCRCWTCGRAFGWAEGPCYDAYPKTTCQFFCEEDQSTCVIM